MIDAHRMVSASPELQRVAAKLKQWEQQLHDLSSRNRLLYYRETRASSAAIEIPALRDLFVTVVEKGKELTVPLATAREMRALETASAKDALRQDKLSEALPDPAEEPADPGDQAGGEEEDLSIDEADPTAVDAQADDIEADDSVGRAATAEHSGKAARDGKLQARARKLRKSDIATNHSAAQLNRVMYNLHYAARTVQEEQGIHILYLTLGMLKWKENHSLSFTRAPLILVPVQIERDNPNAPYRIRMAEEDLLANPVLQIKLSKDFGIQLPELSNDITLEGLEDFLAETADRVRSFPDWAVREDATIGAFNFLTLLLVKDIDNHNALYCQNPLVQLLSGAPGVQIPIPENIPQAEELDDAVDPSQVFQVLDADSSQQEAIEAAKRGLSFVLQGPPGTGKSQTIANIIAESIMAGKRTLFVSQKSAALEVVQKRLSMKGLNEFCLEIHSHKLDKRRILQDLMRSMVDSPLPIPNPDYRLQQEELRKTREELNTYVRQLHEPQFELGLSLYQAQGKLAQSLSAPQLSFSLPEPQHVSPSDYSRMLALVQEAAGYPEIIETYDESRWRGFIGLDSSLEYREELSVQFEAALATIEDLHERLQVVVSACGLPLAETLADDLGYLDTLRLYTPAVFSPVLGPVIERYLGDRKHTGRFFDTQYRQDAAALRAVSRPDVRAQPGEAEGALAFAAKVIRERVRSSDDDVNYLQPLPDLSVFEEIRRQIEQDFEMAKSIFDPAELPDALERRYDQTPAEAADWFAEHAAHSDELVEWVNFNLIREECTNIGIGDFVDKALKGQLPAEQWAPAFSRRFHTVLIERLTAGRPVLQRFKGTAQSDLVRRFRALDLAMIESSAREIRAELRKKKPQVSWLEAGSADTSILRREANKKRRVMPLRRLFAEIPSLIQSLKPCLMMSPLTVCQLLDPAIYEFDLVVFDEASQIPPEYAISAFIRARQVIVAGDSQQLPPTNFFHSLEVEDSEPAGDETEPVFESILSACDSCGFPNKMLNWHYRSKDESLIAYSNYHFYGNRLYTFPNASLKNPSTGLKFVYVPDAVYRGGEGARYNVAEAQRVAELVFEHLKTTPQLSLGIVTLSVPQRRAVETEIEKLRLKRPELNELFTYDTAEPIFVKNLENVQGDERDVIILSIGYGRDAAGKLGLNFGPINQDGGARRLNVAVTRARSLLKLVASIQPEDIDLRRATSRGAYLLRNYMEAARDGLGAVLEERSAGSELDSDSALEDLVYSELTRRGLQVERHVGVSKYRIDLAITDPDREGRYLLGIECDGPMYRSASTARDRDRLRQQVLENLGWRIHRIWSRDWIRNPEGEVERILHHLSASADFEDDRKPAAPDQAGIRPQKEGTRRQVAAKGNNATPTPPAALTQPQPLSAFSYQPSHLKPHDPSGKEAFMAAPLSDIIDDFQLIANAEGPVSARAAKSLVLQAWKIRSSLDVDQRLEMAVLHGAQQKAFRLNGTFLWPMGKQVAALRVHSAGESKRRIDEIAPEEIEVAIRECVKAAVTIRRDDLVREVCRLFGLRATAANQQPVGAVVQTLLQRDVLILQDEKISRGGKF